MIIIIVCKKIDFRLQRYSVIVSKLFKIKIKQLFKYGAKLKL